MGYCTKAQVISLLPNIEECQINDSWIEWASGQIDNYTCTVFGQEVEVTGEKHDIETTNQDNILLDNGPVIEVTELKDDGEVVDEDDYLLYAEEAVVALKTDTTFGALYDTPYFTKGRQKVSVSYKWGYADVPEDIQYVCSLLVAQLALAKLKDTIREQEVESEKIGEYSVSYQKDYYTIEKKINDQVKEAKMSILDNYKRCHPNARAV